MGAQLFTSTGNTTYTMPSYVSSFWAACIGGGGSGEDYVNPQSDDGIYGGGGGAAASATLSGNTANIGVGRGGRRNGNGINGESSTVSGSISGVITAGGGRSGGTSNNTGGGGTSSGGGGNGQDGENWQIILYASGRGGGAGLVGGGNAGRGPAANSGDAIFNGPFGGSGGDGANLPSGQGTGGVDAGSGKAGGDGGSYGGGGGAVAISSPTSIRGGLGGNGAAYISWVDISAGSTTLISGQSTTVSWSSPFGSGSETVSYTNNGTSNITQNYTKTDSKGAQSTIVFTILPPARITNFYASPNPQTSGSNGTPLYSTTLYWTTTGTISSLSLNQGIGNVNGSSSYNVTNLPQSTAGSNSPATRSYTLTASDGYNTVTSQLTVSVYNDNTPNSYTVPSSTTTNVSLSGLEPNTQYIVYVGPITGIDMSTAVTANTAGLEVSSNASSWSSTIYITNGSGVYLRFTSQPFNTNPSGLTSSKTFSFSIGNSSASFTATTRAPIVQEIFDFGNDTIEFPYPDIDQVVNTPDQYIVSPTTINVNDVEIPVEIVSNNPNIEIRIKPAGSGTFGSWQSTRSI